MASAYSSMAALVHWAVHQLLTMLRKASSPSILYPVTTEKCSCLRTGKLPSDQYKFASPPSRAEKAGHYTCIVEHQNKPYSIIWGGSANQPDLTQLHARTDWKCQQVDLGLNLSNIWCNSELINYGADAALRCSHEGPYPIIKLAHHGEEFRMRVEHKFNIIQDMNKFAQSLPIPNVDEHPLLDHQGVFGYRLEYLIRLEQDELLRRLPEVRKAVHQLHEAGFSHGDLSPSNIMRTQDGTIVLIDFGYAGKIGTQASSSVPHWVYEDAIVTVQADQRALERLSKLIERYRIRQLYS